MIAPILAVKNHISTGGCLLSWCTFCEYVFCCRWDLKNHMKNVHEGETVICPMCGSCFSKKSNLYNHLYRGRCSMINEKDKPNDVKEPKDKISHSQWKINFILYSNILAYILDYLKRPYFQNRNCKFEYRLRHFHRSVPKIL